MHGALRDRRGDRCPHTVVDSVTPFNKQMAEINKSQPTSVLCFQSLGPPTLCRSGGPARLFFCAVLISRLWCYCAEVIPHVVLSEQLSLCTSAVVVVLMRYFPSLTLPPTGPFVYDRLCVLSVRARVFSKNFLHMHLMWASRFFEYDLT